MIKLALPDNPKANKMKKLLALDLPNTDLDTIRGILGHEHDEVIDCENCGSEVQKAVKYGDDDEKTIVLCKACLLEGLKLIDEHL